MPGGIRESSGLGRWGMKVRGRDEKLGLEASGDVRGQQVGYTRGRKTLLKEVPSKRGSPTNLSLTKP